MFEQFGNLVSLVKKCISDVIPFMFFFVMWILLFSFLFQLVGLEINLDDYEGFNVYSTYLMYTYRNSIGDLSTPEYNYWYDTLDHNPYQGWLMIVIIWLLWIVN